ncbi:MAG: hypothetical protein IKK72_02580 [Oscillospiraceae bacterium]|nr:hypothetical protein [Oscillospiraceae bacterium]
MNRSNQSNTAGSFSLIAPKNLFEEFCISNDGRNRIEVRYTKEIESQKEYILHYKLSDTIQLTSFGAVLKALETDNIRFAYCDCRGYDDEGFRYYRCIYKIEEIYDLDVIYPSFDAVFCTRDTRLYQFSITTDQNSSNLFYSVKFADFEKPISGISP